METHKAPAEEIDHQEVVTQLVKETQRAPAGNKAQGASVGIPEGANSGAMPHEKKPRSYCIDGQMCDEQTAIPILSQEIDPDSFNFLIAETEAAPPACRTFHSREI